MKITDNYNYPDSISKTCTDFLTSIISKYFFKTFIILFVISISGCADDDKQNEGTPGEKYSLVVNNGTGSGNYSEGETVNISANAPEEDKIFEQWEGDTEVLSNLNASDTSFEMPAQNMVLTATYIDADPVDPGELVSITVNKSVSYQVIEGFGFFGARDVWWGSDSDM